MSDPNYTKYTKLLHGEIRGNVYRKRSTQRLNKPIESWAIACDELSAIEEQAEKIRIYDPSSKIAYTITVEKFRRLAFPVQFGGYEPQMACPVNFFVKSRSFQSERPARDEQPDPAEPKPEPRQFDLFGEVTHGR